MDRRNSKTVDPSQFDEVNKASHYNQSSARCSHCGHQIECIDVIANMPFLVGTIIKYLWRCQLKDDELKDLRKAEYYVKRLISEVERLVKENEELKQIAKNKREDRDEQYEYISP